MRTFLIAVMLVCSSQPALSDVKLLYSQKPTDTYSVNVLCIDGHKFVAANRVRSRNGPIGTRQHWLSDLSMVQMYEERNGKALPAKC